jgi:hypothetical protein
MLTATDPNPGAANPNNQSYYLNAHNFFCYPIDAYRFATCTGPQALHYDSGGTRYYGPYTMTNVLTNAVGYMAVFIGTGMPIQDMIEMCNAAGSDLWFNTNFANSDACLTAIGTYCAANLNPGLKLRVECSNEVWNFGPAPSEFASIASGVYYGATYQDYVPYYCETANHHHTLIKAGWVSGGRSASDFRAIVGTLAADLGTTARLRDYWHAKVTGSGWGAFDELATVNYMDNAPGQFTGYYPCYPLQPVIDGIDAPQNLSIWDINRKYGRFELDVTNHLDTLTGKTVASDGTVSYSFPEFLSTVAVFYEGGPNIVGVSARKDNHGGPYGTPNVGQIMHGIERHPRHFGAMQESLRIGQDSGAKVSNIFAYQGYEYFSAEQWGHYRRDDEPPYTSGNATQDAIQINQPDRTDLIWCITGGAVKAFTSRYGITLSPPTMVMLSGPTSGTVYLSSTAFAVVLDEPAGSGGVIVVLATTGPGDSFLDSSGTMTASITIPAGSISGHFFLIPGSQGQRNVFITSSGLTVGGSPISYTASPRTSPVLRPRGLEWLRHSVT